MSRATSVASTVLSTAGNRSFAFDDFELALDSPIPRVPPKGRTVTIVSPGNEENVTPATRRSEAVAPTSSGGASHPASILKTPNRASQAKAANITLSKCRTPSHRRARSEASENGAVTPYVAAYKATLAAAQEAAVAAEALSLGPQAAFADAAVNTTEPRQSTGPLNPAVKALLAAKAITVETPACRLWHSAGGPPDQSSPTAEELEADDIMRQPDLDAGATTTSQAAVKRKQPPAKQPPKRAGKKSRRHRREPSTTSSSSSSSSEDAPPARKRREAPAAASNAPPSMMDRVRNNNKDKFVPSLRDDDDMERRDPSLRPQRRLTAKNMPSIPRDVGAALMGKTGPQTPPNVRGRSAGNLHGPISPRRGKSQSMPLIVRRSGRHEATPPDDVSSDDAVGVLSSDDDASPLAAQRRNVKRPVAQSEKQLPPKKKAKASTNKKVAAKKQPPKTNRELPKAAQVTASRSVPAQGPQPALSDVSNVAGRAQRTRSVALDGKSRHAAAVQNSYITLTEQQRSSAFLDYDDSVVDPAFSPDDVGSDAAMADLLHQRYNEDSVDRLDRLADGAGVPSFRSGATSAAAKPSRQRPKPPQPAPASVSRGPSIANFASAAANNTNPMLGFFRGAFPDRVIPLPNLAGFDRSRGYRNPLSLRSSRPVRI